MNEEADKILREHETCYAYNDFGYYHKKSMPRHECQKFVDERNRCKGGHWSVRRMMDYKDHFEALKDQIYLP